MSNYTYYRKQENNGAYLCWRKDNANGAETLVSCECIPKHITPINHNEIGAIKMVCSTCGGDDVRRDAWAFWDTIAQDWALHSTYDNSFCETCEGETTLKELPIS